MGDLTEFAKNLTIYRKKMNLSQKKLAELVDVTPQTISAYEKAEIGGKGKNPTLKNAIDIAQKLGVSLDTLCGINTPANTDSDFSYGDAAKAFVAMSKFATFRFGEKLVVDDAITAAKNNESARTHVIYFRGGPLADFLKQWDDLKKLYDTKTINESLYTLWLKDQFSKLDAEYKELEGQLPFD